MKLRTLQSAALSAAWLVLASTAVCAADTAPPAAPAAVEVKVEATTKPVQLDLVEIDMQLPIAAAPDKVYSAFVNDIGRWWDKGFLMGKDSTDVVIEPRPGGMLLELDGKGGGTVWAQVISIYPGRSIRLSIPNGVIWAGLGYYSLSFDDAGDGTTLLKLHQESTQPHTESGDGHSGYVYGWKALLAERLKQYCETGSVPDPIRP